MCENVKSAKNWREIVIYNFWCDREILFFAREFVKNAIFNRNIDTIFRDLFLTAFSWNMTLNREIGHFVA